MSDLAERIRTAANKYHEAEAISPQAAWPTGYTRARTELFDLLHDNAPTILAGLAAIEDVARLRAEVERKDEALRAAQSAIKAFNGPVHPFTGAAVRTAWDKITAALADTAHKPNEGG